MLTVILWGSPAAPAEREISLSEAIDLSLTHSSRVRSAEHDSSASMHDYRAAKSLRFPTFSLKAASFYIDELQSIDIPPRSIEIGAKENYQLDLQLSLPLFTGGKISSQIGARKEEALVRGHILQAQRLSNAYLTRKAYLELMMADLMVKSAEASLQRIQIIKGDAHNLHAGGMADSVDLLDAELAFQKAAQMLEERETARRNASAYLAQLIGFGSDEAFLLSESVPLPSLPDSENQAPTLQRINRPELRAFDHRIQAAEYLVGSANASHFPNVSGYAGYSVGKPNRDFYGKTWNDNFTVGMSLNWEFDLGGQTIRSAQAAKEMVFSTQEDKKDLEESLLLQVKVGLANLKCAYRAFAISQEEYDISKRKFRLAKEKQKAGYMSVNRLLELEAELTATEQLYQASEINYYIKQTEYLYTLGSPGIYGGL
ncbi:MAG: TolC family protein [Candidatus Zixiibacteriota bacterium]